MEEQCHFGGGYDDGRTEYATRITPGIQITDNPERHYAFMLYRLADALSHARHYDGFAVASAMAIKAMSTPQQPHRVINGAVYNPGRRMGIRVCAERAMIIRRTNKGELSNGLALLSGPTEQKTIVGNSPSESLHSCTHCRPYVVRAMGMSGVLLTFTNEDIQEFCGVDPSSQKMVDPQIFLKARFDDLPQPKEGLTVGDMVAYHDFGGLYPAKPQSLPVAQFGVAALSDPTNMHPLLINRNASFRRIDPSLQT